MLNTAKQQKPKTAKPKTAKNRTILRRQHRTIHNKTAKNSKTDDFGQTSLKTEKNSFKFRCIHLIAFIWISIALRKSIYWVNFCPDPNYSKCNWSRNLESGGRIFREHVIEYVVLWRGDPMFYYHISSLQFCSSKFFLNSTIDQTYIKIFWNLPLPSSGKSLPFVDS